MVFVPDYDIAVARALTQGADLWLNTPRRPMEASGTSGMKAALNGGLNCSVLDGWWAECFDGRNGWAVPSAVEENGDEHPELRDQVEASALFDLLEREIVPLFYERRDMASPPSGWLARVRASLRSLGWFVPSSRMVRDYTTQLYEPAAERDATMTASGCGGARELAQWKARVRAAWSGVQVESVQARPAAPSQGESCTVEAAVALGDLGADDVSVQLIYGPVDEAGELTPAGTVAMQPASEGWWSASWTVSEPGRQGFAARVVPSHPHLPSYGELGLVAWA
jgi:starch phosphorylase